jgi:hypothetical protein
MNKNILKIITILCSLSVLPGLSEALSHTNSNGEVVTIHEGPQGIYFTVEKDGITIKYVAMKEEGPNKSVGTNTIIHTAPDGTKTTYAPEIN